ncbi:MAG TPA: hypothetical protein PKL98_00040 [Candidatus Pacearchaeota archaeon]|nr:hypothetical protein [Candidatus Pacearchaeota archaeon]
MEGKGNQSNKIFKDIMFFIDGTPVSMEISDTCSTDKWVIKPLRRTIKGIEFSAPMGILIAFLLRIENSLFKDIEISINKKQASIIFLGKDDVVQAMSKSGKDPEYAKNLDKIPPNDPFAREIAILLDTIKKCPNVTIDGFYRTHHYDPEKPKKKGMFAINYSKHLKEIFE